MSCPDLSLKLLQALCDKDQKTVDECAKDKSVKEWIDNHVDQQHIESAIFTFKNQYKDITCLCFASRYNNTRTVKQLVETGADVTLADSIGNTPLHWVAGSKIEIKEKVDYLLSCDASLVRSQNLFDNTQLLQAAFEGNTNAISVFIQWGVDVNEPGKFATTALHRACGHGRVACIHELMRHGADVEAKEGRFKATPLQLAVHFNHPACVKVLLDAYSASINATNKFGDTALHRAGFNGNLKVVKLLTSYSKCDVTAKNNDGKTAADLAREQGHNNIVDYLTSLGMCEYVYTYTLLSFVLSS